MGSAGGMSPITDQKAGLLVSELYCSLQGESSYAGRPCTFVRLTGCPLRCRWCDSEFAFTGGERISLADILSRVKELGVNLVEVTGGEPLAQPLALDLMRELCDAGYEVLLETSGAVDIAPVDARVVKIVDLKCPGSGEESRNLWTNLKALGPRDELKFVIADRGDYEWTRDVIARESLSDLQSLGKRGGLLLSPVHGGPRAADLAAWMLEDDLPARLQLQLHKALWPGETKGV